MDERVGKLGELLCLLVKAALVTDDAESLGYRRQALAAREELIALGAGAATRIDGAWTRAVREAEAPEMRPREGRVAFGLPAACPLSVEELVSPGFDVDQAVNCIAESAATG